MKRNQRIISLICTCILLSGCAVNWSKPNEEKKEKKPDEVTVQSTHNQLSNDFYRAVIVDGKYQLGYSASEDYNLSSTGNVKSFEDGLMRISKAVFPTDQYMLREGQLIDNKTLTSWLGRESSFNPEGLNPAIEEPALNPEATTEETTEMTTIEVVGEELDGETSEETTEEAVVTAIQSTPIYLSQIMEKNLLIETEDGYALSGVVIGLAMNSSYEYTDSEGVLHTENISVGEIRERGKQFANIIVGRLRNVDELRSVPIVVGIFRNAPKEELAGGTFLLDGISREGNSVTDWTEKNEYRIALPIVNPNDQSEQYTYFDDFRNQIIDFFPNLNGISGEALYVDGGLTSLKIEIISQFYQQTEIAALAQHVTDVAQNTLAEGVAVEILVNSELGAEAYIGRPSGSTQFQSHVFY